MSESRRSRLPRPAITGGVADPGHLMRAIRRSTVQDIRDSTNSQNRGTGKTSFREREDTEHVGGSRHFKRVLSLGWKHYKEERVCNRQYNQF